MYLQREKIHGFDGIKKKRDEDDPAELFVY